MKRIEEVKTMSKPKLLFPSVSLGPLYRFYRLWSALVDS